MALLEFVQITVSLTCHSGRVAHERERERKKVSVRGKVFFLLNNIFYGKAADKTTFESVSISTVPPLPLTKFQESRFIPCFAI